MQPEPRKPRGRAVQANAAGGLDHRPPSSDRRHLALVLVREGSERATRDLGLDLGGDMPAHLHRDRGHHRQGPTIRALEIRGITDDPGVVIKLEHLVHPQAV